MSKKNQVFKTTGRGPIAVARFRSRGATVLIVIKLITFFMLAISTNSCIYGQYIPVPFYLDYNNVEFQKDSLKSIGINKFLLYQINLKTNEACSHDKEVTFFLWDDNNITYVELITDSLVQ